MTFFPLRKWAASSPFEQNLQNFFDRSKKCLTKRMAVYIITINPKPIPDPEGRSIQMRYAAISENMMMDMGMCRMCMRTLRYALGSETFSAPGK